MVHIYDVATGKLARTLGEFPRSTYGIAWSPDGRLAMGAFDRLVRVWDTTTWEVVATLRGPINAVGDVRYSPDGKWLATTSRDGNVRLYDTAGWTLRRTLIGHEAPAYAVAWKRDSTQLVSGGNDGRAIVWEAATGRRIRTLRPAARRAACTRWTGPATARALRWRPPTACTSTMRRPASACAGAGRKSLWRGPLARRHAAGGGVRARRGHAVAGAAGGRRHAAAAGGGAGGIDLGMTTSGPLFAAAWAPGGKLLATADQGGFLRLWDVPNRGRLRTWPAAQGSILNVAFSPDGKRLAAAASYLGEGVGGRHRQAAARA